MMRSHVLVGIALLAVALLVSSGPTQEKKGAKGQLPPGWGKLDLKAEQKAKIYDIQNNYKDKIGALKKQIQELETQQRAEMVKVLTPEQKDLLQKLTIGEGFDKKPKSDK
jgi:Spy/CpxP family protein refolding chaperone